MLNGDEKLRNLKEKLILIAIRFAILGLEKTKTQKE